MHRSEAALDRRRRRRVAKENRKRAERACERCQGRKSKCIETLHGACQRCLQQGLSCRYGSDRDAALHTQPALRASADDTTIELTSMDDVLVGTPPQAEVTDDVGSYFQPTGGVETTGSSPSGIPPAGPNNHAFAVDLSQNPFACSLQPRGLLSQLREAMFLSPAASPEVTADEQAPPTTDVPAAKDPHRLASAVSMFPPKPVADFLTAICINFGTDCFFYFDQRRLMDDLEQFYRDRSSPLRADSNFICLAMMTFALGSQFATLASPEARSRIAAKGHDPGWAFYNAARELIPLMLENPTVMSTQACFMIGVYLLPAQARSTSYLYMGLAMRLAIACGLHKEQTESRLNAEEKEIRRRVWWSLYSLERTVTVKLNLVDPFQTDGIEVPFPQRLPHLDDQQPYDNINHQIANAKLIRILGEIYHALSGLAHSHRSSLPFEDLMSDLKQWKRSLPSALQLQNVNRRTKGFRAVVHLHQNYHYGWIILCRASLVSLVRGRLQSILVEPRSDHCCSSQTEVLARHCVKAAKKTLQIFETLHRTENVTRFSFTDFQGCSIATIVLLLGGIMEPDDISTNLIQFGIDCLRTMATGNRGAEMGVEFVEGFKAIAEEALEKLRQSDTTASNHQLSGGPASTEYNAWLAWFSQTNNDPMLMDAQHRNGHHGFSAPYPTSELSGLPRTSDAGSSSVPMWDGRLTVDSGTAPTNPSIDPRLEPMPTNTAQEEAQNSMAEKDIGEEFSLLDLTGFDVLNWVNLTGN